MFKYLGLTGTKEEGPTIQEIIEQFIKLNQEMNQLAINANENSIAIDETTPVELINLKFITEFINSQFKTQLKNHHSLKEAFKKSNKEAGNVLTDDLSEVSKDVAKLSEENLQAVKAFKIIGKELNVVSQSVLETAKLLKEAQELTTKMQKDPAVKIQDASEKFRDFYDTNRNAAINRGWRNKIMYERQKFSQEKKKLTEQLENKDKQVDKLKKKRANDVKNRGRKGGRGH